MSVFSTVPTTHTVLFLPLKGFLPSIFLVIIAIYILLILKTLNSRHFKCVSHPLVFYMTAITRQLHTDNVKYFGHVIVTCIQSTILFLS